jgi:hypothetical protein
MNSFKFAYHIIFHPFDGFWDMKYEKKGKMKTAVLILFGFIFSQIFHGLVGSFLYNGNYGYQPNIMSYAVNVLIPLVIFCVANWSVTTLMDGEGKLKHIFMAVCYAMLPMVLIRIPLTIISNFITLDEAPYYNFFLNFSTYWFYFLLFIGILTVHQYGVLKTFFTFIMTAVSMFVIVFLGLVFVALLTQVAGFIIAIYNELQIRNL